MPVYAVLTKQADDKVRLRLEQNYRGRYYYWTPTASLLHCADSVIDVADKLGVPIGTQRRAAMEAANLKPPPEPADPVSGIMILSLAASYWGHADLAAWEWLKGSFEGEM